MRFGSILYCFRYFTSQSLKIVTASKPQKTSSCFALFFSIMKIVFSPSHQELSLFAFSWFSNDSKNILHCDGSIEF